MFATPGGRSTSIISCASIPATASCERIIIFHLPQPLNGCCWYLLCQGLGYFSQPRNHNILPGVTLAQISYPSQYVRCF